MIGSIVRWFAPPSFPDHELKTRRASLLNAALITLMALSVILIAGDVLGGRTPIGAIALNIASFVACLVLRYWMGQGKVDLASAGLILVGNIGIAVGIVGLGTIRTPTTAAYLLLVIAAGLLFDLRGIITMTIVSSLQVLAVLWAETNGLLTQADFSVTITQWVTYTALFGVAGGLTWFGLQSARQALRRAENELAERQRAEEMLRRYELMAQHSRDIILFLRLDDGHILEANAAAANAYGYTREELLSMSIRDLRAPETQALVGDQMTKANVQGILFETMHRHKNGHTFLVEVSSQGATIGGIRTLVSVIRDITSRKQAEEELARANEQLTGSVTRLEQRQRESVLLNEMSDALQVCLNVQEAYNVIVEFTTKLFPHDCGALYIIADSRDVAEGVATWGHPVTGVIESAFTPNDCWALRRGRIHSVQIEAMGIVCQHVKRQYAEHALASALCIPMFVQSEVLGLLHLQSADRRISDEKEQLTLAVAERFAPMHASLSLRETLRQQAIRDPLTGLFNRRYMAESLERELHRATRRGTPIGFIMLDLDLFKNMNDLYGHAVGDAMLRSLGRLLEMRVRKEDIVCRYGGEEFLVILPDTPRAETQMRAEQLRQEIQNLHSEHLGMSYGNLTASFGIAIFPDHGTTAETLLHAADAALYQAKQNGRNRVMIAP